MSPTIIGAPAGWRRTATDSGMMISIQVARSAAEFRDGTFTRVDLALNDRQLRSLARDLSRAAAQRGLQLRAPRKWWHL